MENRTFVLAIVAIVLVVLYAVIANNGESEGSGNTFTFPSISTRSTGPATLAEFNRLQTGISYEQARQIISVDGTVMSESAFDDGFGGQIRTVMYGWEGSGQLGANMNAMFQNGRLVQKAQFGLE